MKFTVALTALLLASCSQAETAHRQPEPKQLPSHTAQQGTTMNITIGQHTFTADFAETAAAAELQKRLPLTLTMQDLHRNEKYATLPQALPAADEAVERIEAGDILLWQGDTVVIFYESFTTPYRYTRLGKIRNAGSLKAAVGMGSVQVKFAAQ